jgi:hypothetical protein
MQVTSLFPLRSVVLCFATLLSATVANGDASIREPPIPPIPDEATQKCPSFEPLKASKSFGHEACPIVAQAGVPFHGWIATIRWCGPDRVDSAGAQTSFTTTGPLNKFGYPEYTTEEIGSFYDTATWDQKEHLGGDHVWSSPGEYSVGGQARAVCNHNGLITFNFPQFTAQATVFAPVAPASLVVLGKEPKAGFMYLQFGRVELIEKAPDSGTIVLLSTDKPSTADVQTNFATTGLQSATSTVVYSSTYAYIPPGKLTADFNLLVAASAKVGDSFIISAKCVGRPGNYPITNACDQVNKAPKTIKLIVAP